MGRERQKGGINKGLLKPRSASFRLLIKPDKSGALKRKEKKTTKHHIQLQHSAHKGLPFPGCIAGRNRDKGS